MAKHRRSCSPHCATSPVARFGSAFDETAGVVRFPEPQRLRGELAGIPRARRRNAHVDFFARRNPGHASGDELACLTEINDENLTPAGRRMVARGEALVTTV